MELAGVHDVSQGYLGRLPWGVLEFMTGYNLWGL